MYYFEKMSASGDFAPKPPPGFCFWNPLGNLRLSDSLIAHPWKKNVGAHGWQWRWRVDAACQCDVAGSTDLQCDWHSGQCPCRTNILGRRCNRCDENKYDIAAGCLGLCDAAVFLTHSSKSVQTDLHCTDTLHIQLLNFSLTSRSISSVCCRSL